MKVISIFTGRRIIIQILIVLLIIACLFFSIGFYNLSNIKNVKQEAIVLTIENILKDDKFWGFGIFNELSKEEIIMLYNDDIAYLNNSDFKGKKLKLFTIDQITKKYKEQGEFLYLVLKDVEIKPFSISITLENIDSGGKAFVGGYTEIRYTILFGKIVKSKIEGNFIY
jgi:hypothetical protein